MVREGGSCGGIQALWIGSVWYCCLRLRCAYIRFRTSYTLEKRKYARARYVRVWDDTWTYFALISSYKRMTLAIVRGEEVGGKTTHQRLPNSCLT
jgi:hypothetical protein